MRFGAEKSGRPLARLDLLGDRHRFLLLGMVAVFAACLVFAVARLVLTLESGTATPWWANAAGAVVVASTFVWYRRRPDRRSTFAAHCTATVATVVLLIPLAYGMTSTIWWLSLVSLAMVLLGRRSEAWSWGIAVPVLVAAVALAELHLQVRSVAGEPSAERTLAKVVFAVLVVVIAAGFRRVATQQAIALRAGEERIQQLNTELEDMVRQRTEELERATRELRDSEERYRSLFEQAPIGIYRTTPDGRVLLANPALVRMLGYPSLEKLQRRNLEEEGFQPGQLRRRFKEMLEEHGEIRGFEGFWTRKDGAPIQVQENARAIRDDDGVIMYYEGTVEDITARKQAERGQRRLATAIEQAAEAVVITDPRGAIEYVNPAFERITGYGREEVVGKNPRILKSGRVPDATYGELWRTIGAGKVWSGRLINRRKDGTLYEEEMTISPIRDEQGTLINYVAVKRDVSREVALQQALAQAQKMEAVGRLAGGIAHDFNNLLQAMLAQVAVLREKGPDAGETMRSLVDLDQLARRGAALTRQLLLFSRQEEAMTELLDLNDVVRSVATLLRRIVRENVAIDTDLTGVRLSLLADRGQLDQILMNLVVNASDAMPGGGRITLRSGGNDAAVWLAVSDTGEGISEDVRAHMFEPFFTTKPPGRGTGLGLPVVHGIVTSHGGRVEVGSSEGRGATFTVFLPRVLESASVGGAEAPAAAAAPRGRGESILLVEDEDGARTGLAEILGMLGYTVKAVPNAEEAISFPEAPAFDLLLTDISLSGMPGSDLAAALLERWPTLRVILMSGYLADDAVSSLMTHPNVCFLQKPFDISTLARQIRTVL
jgi:two-component system cell cycle sensor histidine kinase/response regulator CckA